MILGARDMAQWLRALVALAEDLGLIPSTDMTAQNSNSSPRGIGHPLLTSTDTAYTQDIYAGKHSYIHKKVKNF